MITDVVVVEECEVRTADDEVRVAEAEREQVLISAPAIGRESQSLPVGLAPQ